MYIYIVPFVRDRRLGYFLLNTLLQRFTVFMQITNEHKYDEEYIGKGRTL